MLAGLAVASRMFAPLLGCVLLFLAAIAGFNGIFRRQLVDRQTGPETIDQLGWQQFEWLVGESFRRQGYATEESLSRGADGEVDLVLRKDGKKTLVQCKHWKTSSVGASVVRELYGVMAAEKADEGIVVTSGRFSQDAQDFARGKMIQMIAGPQLLAMIKEVQPAEKRESRGELSAPPSCPTCGAAMVRRMARRGPNAGNSFWGCSRFPACGG